MNFKIVTFLILKIIIIFIKIVDNCDENSVGILTLDEYTFDKVMSKFHYGFVKFDHAWPIGLNHDSFVSLGRQLSALTDNEIIVVNLQIDPNNHPNLADRYEVQENDFAALRLFINHNYRDTTTEQFRLLKPVIYPTERDYNLDSQIVLNPITMRLFLWTQINIRTPLPNCTSELDELAEEFVYLLEQNDKNKQIKQIQDKVDNIYRTNTGSIKASALIYAKFMNKSLEQGLPFFDYEHRRIKKLLQDNFHVNEDKKKQLRVRFNILQSFRLRHYELMLRENENARIRDLNPPRIEL